MIEALQSEACAFVVVGGYALAAHGAPRATGDIDVFVRPDASNAARVVAALLKFGAPLGAHGVTQADFALPGTVYQLGLPPSRIDLLTEISGVTFEEATRHAVTARLGHLEVSFIGLEAMIENKRMSGRPKDLVDLATLQALKAAASKEP